MRLFSSSSFLYKKNANFKGVEHRVMLQERLGLGVIFITQ
jgi:hypothetical protein